METIYDHEKEGPFDEDEAVKARRAKAAQCDVVLVGYINGQHSDGVAMRRIGLILGN